MTPRSMSPENPGASARPQALRSAVSSAMCPPEELPARNIRAGSMCHASAWARRNSSARSASSTCAGKRASVDSRTCTAANTKPISARRDQAGRLLYISCRYQALPGTKAMSGKRVSGLIPATS